ncbi:MAG TPA: aminotransferase class IV [Acidimicrobiales bacterium]|nr:aminotransferase class IV [Acidimicrobiales bacterium]
MTVWLDGALVDDTVAAVSVFDHGLTVGDGVFETLLAYPDTGLAFADQHLARLRRSAAGLGLTVPYNDLALAEAMAAVVASHRGDGGARVRVRLTVTGGPAPLGSDRGASGPTVIVVGAPQVPWPATAALAPVPWPRSELSAVAGLKTTSYAENVIALRAAREAGAEEALFCDLQGRVCEGTGSNVFACIDGRLVTPSLATGCLAGVTRGVVLASCDAEERDFTLAELADASEVFVTSTTREVQPVHELIGLRTWETPGPEAAEAAAAYDRARRAG